MTAANAAYKRFANGKTLAQGGIHFRRASLKLQGSHTITSCGVGGTDTLKLDDALASVDNFVAEKLG